MYGRGDSETLQEKRDRARLKLHHEFAEACGRSEPRGVGQLPSVLEDLCWAYRCTAERDKLRGALAEHCLYLLLRLKYELGDGIWLSAQEAKILDKIEKRLRRLASDKKRGRPKDQLGKGFRRDLRVSLRTAPRSKRSAQSIKPMAISEIGTALYPVALGRRVSWASYVRMDKRDRARDRDSRALLRQLEAHDP
jgi:hypothetical protein